MNHQPTKINPLAALMVKDIQLFIGSVSFFTLASRALAVVIGFQIYQLMSLKNI